MNQSTRKANAVNTFFENDDDLESSIAEIYPFVSRFCGRLFHRNDAEDGTQAVMMRLWRWWQSDMPTDPEHRKRHAIRACRFAHVQHQRESCCKKRDRRRETLWGSFPAIQQRPEYDSLDIMESVTDEVDRCVIQMRSDGYTLDEIASDTGMSRTAVYRRIEGIRGQLAEIVAT